MECLVILVVLLLFTLSMVIYAAGLYFLVYWYTLKNIKYTKNPSIYKFNFIAGSLTTLILLSIYTATHWLAIKICNGVFMGGTKLVIASVLMTLVIFILPLTGFLLFRKYRLLLRRIVPLIIICICSIIHLVLIYRCFIHLFN